MTETRDDVVPGATDTMVGPYRLERLIGRGGMGEVFRAYDTRRGRVVALKLLAASAEGAAYRERFRREANSAAGLRDPHVVPIHDFGEMGGRLFLDMRLVDGVGLDSVLLNGPLTPERAVHVVGQVAQALDAAHATGLVHRDVKPSNILITSADFVYLADFGIARAVDDETGMTTTGSAIGTAAYMAPERFDGGPPDPRSDVYSLACVLAECLLGRTPFEASSFPGQMKAHLLTEPPRPSRMRPGIPLALDGVIATGMSKDLASRYRTAGELAEAAARAMAEPVGPPTRSMPEPGREASAGDPGVESWLADQPPFNATPVSAARAETPRTRRAAVVAALVVVVAAVGIAAFGAGRSGAGSDTAAAPAPVVPAPAPAAVSSPAGQGGRSSAYNYSIDSNYPVYIGYTDARGDQILPSATTPAPWRLDVPTDGWGADQRPTLSVSSSSTKGDTFVSCTITDAAGKVVASDRKESAYASSSCSVY